MKTNGYAKASELLSFYQEKTNQIQGLLAGDLDPKTRESLLVSLAKIKRGVDQINNQARRRLIK